MKLQITSLRLVYPPISNQVADWLKSDPDVEAVLRKSNLYMVAQREEPKFTTIRWRDPDLHLLEVNLRLGDAVNDSCLIDLHEVAERHMLQNDHHLEVIGGNFASPNATEYDVVELAEVDPHGSRVNSLEWFTTDKLLFERWRRRPIISGLSHHRDFTRYRLLYVGISKVNDSFERLLNTGHEKRLAILSNERQLASGARVTDETYLFFFRVDPLFLRIVETDHDLSEFLTGPGFDYIRNIADAEKAFVSVLQSRYNDVRFGAFPKGDDGLYGAGLTRYGYVISEDVEFVTDAVSFRGGYGVANLPCSNDADLVLVEGDEVSLHRAQEMLSNDS